MAKRLCSIEIEMKVVYGKTTSSIESYTACRLIPLEKKPDGVRPIGIGEVLRRIIGKAVLSVFKEDVMQSAGSLQLCAGQSSGCEAAIHAMSKIFEEDTSDAILLVDASNAFNTINRKAVLHNIQCLCPSIARYVINCYQHPSRLFVLGGGELSSEEGTTQGDPLAMPTYAIGITPLLAAIKDDAKEDFEHQTKHVAYADDIAGIGKLKKLRKWWDDIVQNGPLLGYHPKASKSWLVVKDDQYETAAAIFKGSGVNITSEGRKYLGGAIGKDSFRENYVRELVESWRKQIETLAVIARSEPQAALAAYNSGLKHKFTYHLGSVPGMEDHVKPVEDAIRNKLLPALTDGHHFSDKDRLLLSLPPKLGGLGIPIMTKTAAEEHQFSQMLTKSLSSRIYKQEENIGDLVVETRKAKNEITRLRKDRQENDLKRVRSLMNEDEIRANDIAQMKGASNWITTLPIKEENYVLNKREFFDAITVRYRWEVKKLPITCVCGSPFTIDHAMSCKKGGYIIHRHNEIRDTLAKMLEETCRDVKTEPVLLPLTGEELNPRIIKSDNARLDTSAVGFWTRGEQAFFDTRIFNPFALKHRRQNLAKAFKSNEAEKKRSYNQRIIEVEHGSFTPLVLSANGGMGRECQHFISTLADKIATKRNLPASEVTNWIRTKICFALIRSLELCLRGTRRRCNELAVDTGNIILSNTISTINE